MASKVLEFAKKPLNEINDRDLIQLARSAVLLVAVFAPSAEDDPPDLYSGILTELSNRLEKVLNERDLRLS